MRNISAEKPNRQYDRGIVWILLFNLLAFLPEVCILPGVSSCVCVLHTGENRPGDGDADSQRHLNAFGFWFCICISVCYS